MDVAARSHHAGHGPRRLGVLCVPTLQQCHLGYRVLYSWSPSTYMYSHGLLPGVLTGAERIQLR